MTFASIEASMRIGSVWFGGSVGLTIPAAQLSASFSFQVLWVIASGVNDRIFDQRGARAIIQLAWREAEVAHFIAFFVVPWLQPPSSIHLHPPSIAVFPHVESHMLNQSMNKYR